MKKTALIVSSFFALPFVAFAQAGQLSNIQALIVSFGQIVQTVIPILVGCAIVVFFWGLVMYIKNAEKGSGQKTMIAGLSALFIMVSVWGIIIFAQNAIGIGTTATPIPAPHFQ